MKVTGVLVLSVLVLSLACAFLEEEFAPLLTPLPTSTPTMPPTPTPSPFPTPTYTPMPIPTADTSTSMKNVNRMLRESIAAKPVLDERQVERRIFALANNERVIRNLHILHWNDKLAETARAYSRYMADNDHFSHVSLDSEDMDGRFERQGVNCTVKGENLSLQGAWKSGRKIRGVEINEWLSESELAARVVRGWMNSALGHGDNVLYKRHDFMGIGVATKDLKIFITQHMVGKC